MRGGRGYGGRGKGERDPGQGGDAAPSRDVLGRPVEVDGACCRSSVTDGGAVTPERRRGRGEHHPAGFSGKRRPVLAQCFFSPSLKMQV